MKNWHRAIILHLPLATVMFFLVWNGGIALSAPPPPPDPAAQNLKTGTVTGRFVVQGGGSMAGGKVMLYNAESGPPPHIGQYKRVPTLIVEIDPEGIFQATVPVGRYYLVAVKRNSGKQFGKPRQGDFSYRYNKPGGLELNTFSVSEGDRLDLGTLDAHPWQENRLDATPGGTTIKGIITDPEGRPIENALVFAFSTPRMQGRRPEFISEKTGKDGKFALKISGDATYYLMARDKMGGGQLQEGELIGVYGEAEPRGVTIRNGETVEGIDFQVARMGRRGPGQAEPSDAGPGASNELSQNPSPLPSTLPGPLPGERGREEARSN